MYTVRKPLRAALNTASPASERCCLPIRQQRSDAPSNKTLACTHKALRLAAEAVMKRYARKLSLIIVQVCIMLTPCVVLGQVIVGRTPDVNTSSAVDAVSQTIADALSTANLTAAAAAISSSAKGIARHVQLSAHLLRECFCVAT